MKKKEDFVEETMEQKHNRWDKQTKTARSFAKQCGVNLKKISKEREKNEAEKRMRTRTQFF